jgi:hypothetical protein
MTERPPILEQVPLATDEDGSIRVSGAHGLLDLVIDEFKSGATAESVAWEHPAFALADVNQALAYHLRHTGEIDEHLARRQEQGARIRRQFEARFDPNGIRERLLARRRSE